jgi:hypothetical protein
MPGGQFIVPSESMDRLLKDSGGRLDYVKKALGIPADAWNEPLVRIDIGNPLLHNVRMPTGLEPGANLKFRAGGHTSGGIPEAVVGRMPSGDLLDRGVVKLK